MRKLQKGKESTFSEIRKLTSLAAIGGAFIIQGKQINLGKKRELCGGLTFSMFHPLAPQEP